MDFDFYKLQTAGNDFILVNFSDGSFPEDSKLRELSRQVCRRDYGIGGNGLIAVEKLSSDNIKARLIDPSGAFPDTTNDAALCLSRYIFDYGLTGKEDFSLEINSKKHSIGIIDSINFRLSLGIPLNEEGTELIEHPDKEYIKMIQTDERDFPAAVINLEKTGVVVFSEGWSVSKMKELSDIILKATQLDKAQRLIFATINSREELEVHIRNSRGDDFSSSCAIAATAAVVNGFLDRTATITHKLGEYYFQWLHPSNEIFITGSADYIYSGSIFIDS